MSSFSTPIVQIGKVGKHPNADNLSITQIMNFPVVFRTGSFKEGDIAVYIPEDALVPEATCFSFLWTGKDKPTEKDRVIRAKKLRGIYSEGLLIPADCFVGFAIGTDVSKMLGIEKWEKKEVISVGGDNEATPGFFYTYTEIENIRKYADVLEIGENVRIQEKIHGANARFCFHQNRLWIGSHHNTKRQDTDNSDNIWTRAAKKLDIENKLKASPGIIFFGEVYGQVQNLKYGEDLNVVLFDAYDIEECRYLDFNELAMEVEQIGMELAPMVYSGTWNGLESMQQYAEGKSLMPKAQHHREGVVIRPVKERFDNRIGRVILKMISREYLLKKKD